MFGFAGMFFLREKLIYHLVLSPQTRYDGAIIRGKHYSERERKQGFRWGHLSLMVKEEQKIISDFLLGNAAGGQQVFMGFRLRLVNEEQYELRLLSRQNNTNYGTHKGKGSHSDEQPF